MIALEGGATVGRYVLTSRLASGGMAEVWLARATGPGGFEKTVVIKTILPHLAEDPEFVRMFVNEARLAASLHHANIVQIFELGEVEGGYFIAMEYIPGRSLRDLQKRAHELGKVLPPWLVCQVSSEVCEALAYAHEAVDGGGHRLGLVHRDITPENVMVTYAGDTKVLDFGVAKASPESVTQSGVLKGKLAYLAPEQINASVSDSAMPDHRVDIYALGVIMYELATSEAPYQARHEVGLLRAIVEPDVQPQRPRALAPWVSEPLERLILRALSKDPNQRFQHAAEMRAALDHCLVSHGLYPTKRHVATHIEALFPHEDEESPSRPFRRSPSQPILETSFLQGSERSSQTDPAVVAFEEGLDSIRSRNYPRALDALERALELDPDNRVYRSNLNKLRQRLEERERG